LTLRTPRFRSLRPTILSLVLLAALVAAMLVDASPASAATCPPPPTLSTPFTSWGDSYDYALSPGAAFETGLSGWSATGGAAIVAGNEPWYLRAKSDSHALYLPSGSSVTSSPICEPHLQPLLRLFVKNVGSSTGQLHVEMIVVQNGTTYLLDGGLVSAGASWSLTQRIASSWSGPLSGSLQVRLTPVGTGAAFVVDDLYVDPYLCK
jgi:hypothetical protein